jgi:hypothetical protein
MDNPLDPRIPRAALSLRPAALPPLSETHMCFRGDPLLWNHRSVAPEDMPGLRFRWWAARANRIEEASHRFETSSKELRLAKHKVEAQVNLRGEMLRDVSIWQRRIDFELGLMAEVIFTGSTAEERTRMPVKWHEQPVQLFKCMVREAKSQDQLRRCRWACIVGEVSCPPSPPAMQ